MQPKFLMTSQPLDAWDLNNLYDGEVVFNPETNMCYIYSKGELIPLGAREEDKIILFNEEDRIMKANYEDKIQEEKVNGNLNLSLYDLNKSAVGQLPDYTDEDFAKAVEVVNNFVGNDKFYMLLGREVGYYTVFMREPTMTETIGEAVIDCLKYFSSSVKSIEITEDGSGIEIWVMHDDIATVMYFFPYNQGVVICK